MTLRYTGTYERTTYQVVQTQDENYQWSKGCVPVTEVYLDVLDAGARFALAAIWRQYTYLTTITHRFDHVQVQRQVDLVVVVARETMANIVVGREHLHTSACEAGQCDCPIFTAGEELAKETVGEWVDLSDFAPDFP